MHQHVLRSAAGVVGLALVVGTTSSASAAVPSSAPPAPVVRPVAVALAPVGLDVSQRLGQAFVATDSGVSVLSLSTHAVVAQFSTGGSRQSGIALVRGGRQAYLTSRADTVVTVVDTTSRTVVKRIPVGGESTGIVVATTPRGQRAYVALSTNEVVVIATSTGTVVQRVRLPRAAKTLTVRPGGRTVWAGSYFSGRMWAIGTRMGRIERTVRVPKTGPVSGIAFVPGARRAWVAGVRGVSVVDLRTGRTVRFLPTSKLFSGFPISLGAVAFTRSGRHAFVVDSTLEWASGPGRVAMLDARTLRVVWRVRTGFRPTSLTLDRERRTAYTTDVDSDTVSWFRVPR